MTIPRGELLNNLCRKIGLKRMVPDRKTFSKRELTYLIGWVDTAKRRLEGNENVGRHTKET